MCKQRVRTNANAPPYGVPLRAMFPLDETVISYFNRLPALSAKERKAIVTLCRAQYVPSRSESKVLSFQAFGHILGVEAGKSTPLKETVKLVKKYIENPFYSGLILDLARLCEPSKEEIEDMAWASWSKEMMACNTDKRDSSLNYRAIFHPEYFEESLVPHADPRPEVNAYIHRTLTEWRADVCSRILFPRMSSKACSHHSKSLLQQYWPTWKVDMDPGDDDILCSQETMERLYCETGVEVPGPCEMRQKLYRAGITPRTYFAQGGDAYSSSKYIQLPCTLLVNSIPSSHHLFRLIPTMLDYPNGGNTVFIYDLTSFTSMFHEFLPFIRQLGDFCLDHTVTIWDGRQGYVDVDLGLLLHRYATVNAFHPAYSAHRADKSYGVFYHVVAGFLGVYGNLMFCTYLHCLVVLSIVGSVGKCYTAGDDGGAVLYALLVLLWPGEGKSKPTTANDPRSDVALLFYALSLLGIIEWSKVFTIQEAGAIALKRPLQVFENRLTSPPMCIWPQSILIRMYTQWKEHRDPRFHTYYMFTTRPECRSAIITEVTRFLTHLSAMEYRIADEDLRCADVYLRWIYDTIGAPVEGYVPQFGSDKAIGDFVPALAGTEDLRWWYSRDPVRRTVDYHWSGWADLPCREGECDYTSADPLPLYVGATFTSRSTPLLAYLKKTRYIARKTLFRRVVGEESYDLLCREYLGPYPLPANIYEYHVNALPPVLRT
jgi:hypothetical protein